MSFGTYFNANIYISRKLFDNKEQLEQEIESHERIIKRYKNKLMNLICSTPKDIAPEDCSPLDYISTTSEIILEDLEEELIQLYRLELLRDNWDTIERDEY